MKDNKVDKAFKEGLQGGKMPYSDSYWAAMETLIPAPVTTQVPAAKAVITIGYRIAVWVLGITMAGTAAYFWLIGSAENESVLLPNPVPVENVAAPNAAATQPFVESSAKTSEPVTETKNTEAVQAVEPKSLVQTKEKTSVAEAVAPPAVQTTLNENPGKVSTTSTGGTRSDALKEVENAVLDQSAEEIIASELSSNTFKKLNDVAKENEVSEPEFNIPEAIAPFSFSESLAAAKPELNPVTETKPIILPHQKGKAMLWSAGLEYQYLLLNRSLTTTDANLNGYVAFRNTYEKPSFQSCIGFNVQLEMENWLFNSGIHSTSYHEEVNYPKTLLVNVGEDNGQWQINEIWNYSVDSAWVIDSIFVGHWQHDTAWTLTLDSLYQPQWDSVATEKEVPEMAANNSIFSLNYVEIPLWFGRSFGKNRLHVDVQGGLGFGVLTSTSGSLYINQRLDGLVTQAYQVEQFSRLNISGMLRAGIRYEFTEQLQVLLYPTLRYTFTSVFQEAAIRQRYMGYGLSVGLLYRF